MKSGKVVKPSSSLFVIVLFILLLCFSLSSQPYYVLAFNDSKSTQDSNDNYITPTSHIKDIIVNRHDRTVDHSVNTGDSSPTEDTSLNAPVPPTEDTSLNAPVPPTEDTSLNAPVPPTEDTSLNAPVPPTEDTSLNAPVPPTEDTAISEGPGIIKSVTNQSSIQGQTSGTANNLNDVSIISNNSSSFGYHGPGSDGTTSSALESGTTLVTNDTSLAPESGTTLVTNDTSLAPESGTTLVTNDTSLAPDPHPHSNSDIGLSLPNSSMQFSGPMSGTSKEILSSSDPNSVVQKVRPGDSRFTFRNISDKTNSSKDVKIKFDKPSGYNIGETATITVTDSAANLDPKQVNTITLSVSTESDPNGILVVFTETGKNTGKFTGSFLISDRPSSQDPLPAIQTKTGDHIEVVYVASHARLRATLNGVTTGGEVTVRDFALSPFQKTLLDWNPIGNGAQIKFTDIQTISEPTITVTMSYADAFIENIPLNEFVIFKSTNGDDWEKVCNLASDDCRANIDQSSKTVTVQTRIDPSVQTIFMIGECPGCGSGGFGSPGGGGGGGIGLPGSGVVLDLLAPVVALTPPSEPPSTNPPKSLSPPFLTSTDLRQTTNPTPALISVSELSANSSADQSDNNSKLIKREGSKVELSAPEPRNYTITFPQIGTVMLFFSNLMSQGPVSVIPIQSQLGLSQLKIEQSKDDSKNMTVKIGNTMYYIAGTPLEIGPSSLMFDGTITISIPYNQSMANNGDQVRLLYFNGGHWEDLTAGVNIQSHNVIGELESLGTIVAAVRSST